MTPKLGSKIEGCHQYNQSKWRWHCQSYQFPPRDFTESVEWGSETKESDDHVQVPPDNVPEIPWIYGFEYEGSEVCPHNDSLSKVIDSHDRIFVVITY